MGLLLSILLILCGLIAAWTFIKSKSPNAGAAIAKLVPFQGFMGVALLVVGVIALFRWLSYFSHLGGSLFGIVLLASTVSAILLGFLLGMPQIARWIPGETPAEQKAVELQKKLGAYSTLVGIIGLVAGVLLLLYRLRIL